MRQCYLLPTLTIFLVCAWSGHAESQTSSAQSRQVAVFVSLPTTVTLMPTDAHSLTVSMYINLPTTLTLIPTDAHSRETSALIGPNLDCNANGVPDCDDFVMGNSADCNSNGRPDECDIGALVSQDCDNDGVPDECAQPTPAITSQPTPVSTCPGEPATFAVTASGTAPLTYQWQLDGLEIPGATSDTLSIGSVEPRDAGIYDVVVTDTCGSLLSLSAPLVVHEPIVVTSEPNRQDVCEGDPATLEVIAAGSSPLSYQWRIDGAAIAGATTSSFTIPSVSLPDKGVYDCVISNPCGVVTSAGATLSALLGPSITSSPTAETLCPGDTLTLATSATGAIPLSYQWQRDGSSLAGEVQATLTIVGVSPSDAGRYTCVVSNMCGTAVSTPATILIDQCGTPFVRGDCNGDGTYDIADAITTLAALFPGSGAPPSLLCQDACDCNDDEALDIGDAICMLNGLFGNVTVPPPAPHPGCGLDPGGEEIDCDSFNPCP